MMDFPARMRWASRTQFFGSGFVFATWGVHIPTVKAHYGVNEAELGFAMLAAGVGALLGLLVVFGIVTSVFDVAINTEAAQLELRGGTPLMSGMHGMFSLGGMVGAMTGGAAIAAGMAPQHHLMLVAAVMALSIAVSARWMLPKESTAFASDGHGFRLPRGTLAVLG